MDDVKSLEKKSFFIMQVDLIQILAFALGWFILIFAYYMYLQGHNKLVGYLLLGSIFIYWLIGEYIGMFFFIGTINGLDEHNAYLLSLDSGLIDFIISVSGYIMLDLSILCMKVSNLVLLLL